MRTDIRLAIRSLVTRPAFTALAVLALALGTGANALVFSVLNGVLLRPLPYADARRLYVVEARGPSEDKNDKLSPPDLRDLRARSRSFAALGGVGFASFDLTGTAAPNQVRAGEVTTGLFGVLGLQPLLGRAILDEEAAAGAPVVALDEALWRSQFNADPAVVGRAITLDGRPYTVVGVLPHVRLRFGQEYELWTTAAPEELAEAGREARTFTVLGRLRAGVGAEEAGAELAAISRQLAAEHPRENAGYAFRAVGIRDWLAGSMRPALLVLLGAVTLVLLIACTNVAHMLLARASQRGREVAVRTALGATRGRIVRQLLAESAALALAGTAAGVALAALLLPALVRLSPLDEADRALVGLDARVLLASLAVAAVATLVFGLWPALAATRVELHGALAGDGARGATGRGTARTRGLLVVSEVALAAVLLSGAGLLIKSLDGLLRVERGFDPTLVVTTGLVLPGNVYPKGADKREFMRAVFERLRATPGVEVAAAANFPPTHSGIQSELQVVGRAPVGPPSTRQVTWRVVTPDYFRALRIPVLRGRALTDGDAPTGPRVVVISQALARRYFPGADPIGRELRLVPFGPPVVARVVGVVGDVRNGGRTQAVEPDLYLPYAQSSGGYVNLVVRGRQTTPAALHAAINRAVLAVDPARPTFAPGVLAESAADDVAQPRFGATLMSLFAGVAALLACIGIFGVMAHAVSARTREIGIRMALGGEPGTVLALVLRPGLALVAAGAAVGVLAALAAGRVLASQLYGVAPTDPAVLAAAVALLTAVGAVACYVPARRATRVNPVAALRAE